MLVNVEMLKIKTTGKNWEATVALYITYNLVDLLNLRPES